MAVGAEGQFGSAWPILRVALSAKLGKLETGETGDGNWGQTGNWGQETGDGNWGNWKLGGNWGQTGCSPQTSGEVPPPGGKLEIPITGSR